jgi:hypothetical protein
MQLNIKACLWYVLVETSEVWIPPQDYLFYKEVELMEANLFENTFAH